MKKQLKISLWFTIRRIAIYYTGARRLLKFFIKPDEKYKMVTDISYETIKKIKESGVKGIILDMDGTIKHYKKGVSSDIKQWVDILQENFNVCLLSNANKELVEEVTIPLKIYNYIYKAHKPSKEGFDKAIEKLNLPKEDILVIGDAIIGDIWGAKRNNLKIFAVDDLNAKSKV